MNPKPGTKYSEENNNIFNPDVIVTKNNQNWEVELNDSTPKVTVNQEYIDEVKILIVLNLTRNIFRKSNQLNG